LGNYLAKKKGYDKSFTPDVANMVVEKALVVQGTGPQSFQASLDFNWSTNCGKNGDIQY
jgi:hypothetical protein